MTFVQQLCQPALANEVKHSLIVVVIPPIVCVYPFLQKHFVKGILVGGIKE
ncbi:MAG TPA: hypothetical protein VE287_09000 [Actinopolymorphaceae bacterium]|nr:hypothetical protein [Actinopolymorphaceae bacterium]